MMTTARRTRRRALVLAATLATLGAGSLALVMADSAGATAPAGPAASAPQHTIVPMSPPTRSQAAGPSRSPGPLSASTARAVVRVSASPAVAASTQKSPQLAGSQVPGFAAEQWKPVGVPVTRAVDGHDIGENECASVAGASGWVQQSFSGGDGQNVAIQDTFTFADASGARSALSSIATGMAGCQGVSRALQQKNGITPDAQVAKSAGSAFADAWQRRWTGVMGMSAYGPQTNHIYAAVSGSELIVLQFTEFPGQAAAYHTAADPGVLTMLLKESAQ